MNPTRLGIATAVVSATVLLTPGAASAKPSGDPNVERLANPANACAAIPGTLAQSFGIMLDDFDYSGCVRVLAKGAPRVPMGLPSERCAQMEAGVVEFGVPFTLTYPYTFHAEPGDPFPNLRAENREQCARAVYVFHSIASRLGPPPPPPA